MPKYSFICQKCQEEFTVTCKYEEKSEASCPQCGSQDKKVVYKLAGHGSGQTVTERMGIHIPPPGHFLK